MLPRATPDRPVRAGRVPQVGAVLRETFTEARDRSLAWAAATMVVAVGGLAADTPGRVLLGVVLLGLAALAWVSRRLVGLWLALRDFERAVTEPRRAHVLLLRDPNPRVTRPAAGRVERGADPRRRAAAAGRGGLPVRCPAGRAALDAGRAGGARGVARHRARSPLTAPLGGGGCRHRAAAPPGHPAAGGTSHRSSPPSDRRRPRQLTMPAPHPTMEAAPGTAARAVTEATPETGRWVWLFAWRLAGLVLAAAVLAWLVSRAMSRDRERDGIRRWQGAARTRAPAVTIGRPSSGWTRGDRLAGSAASVRGATGLDRMALLATLGLVGTAPAVSTPGPRR